MAIGDDYEQYQLETIARNLTATQLRALARFNGHQWRARAKLYCKTPTLSKLMRFSLVEEKIGSEWRRTKLGSRILRLSRRRGFDGAVA